MRRLVFAVATVLSAAAERDGNRFTFPTAGGALAIEFASPVSFQCDYRREAKPARGVPLSPDALDLKLKDDHVVSRFLDVAVSNGSITIKTIAGREVTTLSHDGGKIRFKTTPDEMFYGLGATQSLKLNLRGEVIHSRKPLMLSSRGYGLFFPNGSATFDLTNFTIDQSTAQFYFGPNPKEILEQHVLTIHNQIDLDESTLSIRDDKKLPSDIKRLDVTDTNYCDSPRVLNQLSLSGELFPALDLARLPEHAQLVRLLPFLYDSKRASHPALEERRSPWTLYLIAYLREAHDRGLPFIRPLLMQFPQDKGLDSRQEVYMIGDEILVSPGCQVTEIELPRGTWTDLRTNTRHAGRQKIANDPKAGLPIFAKAGSLIPLNAATRLELHYFPNLGGEFFVYEPEANEYSQFHAAPSGDFLRVESESKVARTCEWVLHHTAKPLSVGETGKPYKAAASLAGLRAGTWFHNPTTGNLHIVMATQAGEDHIINLAF